MGGKGSGRRPKPAEAEIIPIETKPVCHIRQWKIQINQQVDTFNDLASAQEYARGLINAKVWFIKLYSKREDC